VASLSATPPQAAELTAVIRPPAGAGEVPVTIRRLHDGDETGITRVRQATGRSERGEDWGANGLLTGTVLLRHELQVWFLSEHLAGAMPGGGRS
jgi:starvation-inducible DNA-binding protein